MIKLFKPNHLWLLVSLAAIAISACKTKPTPKPEAPIIEQPRPATEYQTDSLKKVLDEQRKQKNR